MPYLVDVFLGAIAWSIASVIAAVLFCSIATFIKRGSR